MKYKIKRMVRAGLKNGNGKIFEVKSTNNALNKYIGKPIVLINKGDDYLNGILPEDKIVGYLSDYDDTSITCNLYADILPDKFYSKDYVASLSASANIIEDGVLCIIKNIRKIVIWKEN